MEAMIKEAKSSSLITTSLLPHTQEVGRGTPRQIPQSRKYLKLRWRTREKKSNVTIVTKNMNLGISVKGDKFIC